MTREKDTLLADEGAGTVRAQKRSDLKNRLEIMEGTPNSVGVSIHQNHFSQSYVHGAQVFYGKADGSRELAERIQKNIATYLQTDNKRKIKEADSSLFILNNNRANPSVMVECGFYQTQRIWKICSKRNTRVCWLFDYRLTDGIRTRPAGIAA